MKAQKIVPSRERVKTCFKCGGTKPLTDFYFHPRMADCRLNKCKECTKKDTAERVERLKGDPKWVIKERARCREKITRARREGRVNESTWDKRLRRANWESRNPEKRKAHSLSQHIPPQPCIVCGKEDAHKHHEDYSKPMDIVFLCSHHHAMRHVQIRDCETLGIPLPPISPTMFDQCQQTT